MYNMKSKYCRSLQRQKALGAAFGVLWAVLGVAIFTLSVIYLFLIDYSSDWPMAFVPLFGSILFGAGIFLCIRDVVRRWREISKLQELLRAMPDDELNELDAAIGQFDFELFTDDSGKTHFRTVDYDPVLREKSPIRNGGNK